MKSNHQSEVHRIGGWEVRVADSSVCEVVDQEGITRWRVVLVPATVVLFPTKVEEVVAHVTWLPKHLTEGSAYLDREGTVILGDRPENASGPGALGWLLDLVQEAGCTLPVAGVE